MISPKIIDYSFYKKWRTRHTLKKVVATNGCFDIIHVGHTSYLNKAKQLGDILVVGLNGDKSVKELKGDNRPINNQDDRAEVLSALHSVDFVIIFEEARATEFLSHVKPNIYVKAGDYNLESLDKSEKQILDKNKTEIKFLPYIKGKSTSKILSILNHENQK